MASNCLIFKEFSSREQPPSGGCVLKPLRVGGLHFQRGQPPSGGCVLKHVSNDDVSALMRAAAFGRLCVETPPNVPSMP